MTLVIKIPPLSSQVPQGDANDNGVNNPTTQSLVLSSGDFKLLNIVILGDKNGNNKVLEYDPKFGEWKNHSQLKYGRLAYGKEMKITISMPKGVYLFGGAIKPLQTRLA